MKLRYHITHIEALHPICGVTLGICEWKHVALIVTTIAVLARFRAARYVWVLGELVSTNN